MSREIIMSAFNIISEQNRANALSDAIFNVWRMQTDFESRLLKEFLDSETNADDRSTSWAQFRGIMYEIDKRDFKWGRRTINYVFDVEVEDDMFIVTSTSFDDAGDYMVLPVDVMNQVIELTEYPEESDWGSDVINLELIQAYVQTKWEKYLAAYYQKQALDSKQAEIKQAQINAQEYALYLSLQKKFENS